MSTISWAVFNRASTQQTGYCQVKLKASSTSTGIGILYVLPSGQCCPVSSADADQTGVVLRFKNTSVLPVCTTKSKFNTSLPHCVVYVLNLSRGSTIKSRKFYSKCNMQQVIENLMFLLGSDRKNIGFPHIGRCVCLIMPTAHHPPFGTVHHHATHWDFSLA